MRGVPKGFKVSAGSYPISKCAKKSIRSNIVSSKKRILTCCPSGKFKNGRCRVGTRSTKILTKVS